MSPCRKVRYLSRSAAARARRKIRDGALRPYRCEDGCEPNTWHLGHLRLDVRQGLISRDEAYGGDEGA